MTMTMSINMDMGAGQAMALPAMSLSFDCEVKEVASGGDITMGMVLSDVGVDEGSGGVPGMAAAIKAAMGGMKGLSTTSTLSDRGVTKDSQVQLPADTDPQARQMLESMKDSLGQLAVLLPEEAVGPGAKWEVRQPVKSQEMTIMQTATYQLISSEGDRLSLKSTVAQSAANQKIESPAMPGMKMDLVKMTGRASGEATIDLGQLLPAHASMDVQSEMNMNINMGNQKQPLQIKTGIKLLVETK
jgi:hypothetical protein